MVDVGGGGFAGETAPPGAGVDHETEFGQAPCPDIADDPALMLDQEIIAAGLVPGDHPIQPDAGHAAIRMRQRRPVAHGPRVGHDLEHGIEVIRARPAQAQPLGEDFH